MKASKLFNFKQKKNILDAIKQVESRTSGEIRLHIENICEIDLMERTQELFQILQMHHTANRNGVLIYLALLDKKVAIIGDEGIDQVTPDDYWENEVKSLIECFKKNDFEEGMISCIQQIGSKLQTYFPITKNDINELQDEISIYDN